ncbi:MAG: 4'-phosphopantetheinyl transferase superfamily protein [Rhodobacteraceae bacterium]|nr:4'-phosphopantetheinyl transferase superfamily protein [Paracoccaceae bacterium]
MLSSDFNVITNGFIKQSELLQIPERHAALVTAAVDPERYNAALFEQLVIPTPPQFQNMAPKRQVDFLAGRLAAAMGLDALGRGGCAVGIGADRVPVWPMGTTGSISHTSGICASLVSRDADLSCGIDTEHVATGGSLDAIYRKCLSESEHAFAFREKWYPAPVAATLLFSAKETVFKAFYPRVRRFFGFESAEMVSIDRPDSLIMRLTESLHPDLPKGLEIPIDFTVTDNRVLTYLIYAE